jgi:small subunit ribosomal protein S4
MYGLLEKQFRSYFAKADQMKGETGTNLMELLERRLDNVVYRLSFASSRPQARQLVNHAHFLVNDKKVNIPSYLVKSGDQIKVRDKSKKLDVILDSVRLVKGDLDLPWLELDKAKLTGTFTEVPKREDMGIIVNEQLIVELYSK